MKLGQGNVPTAIPQTLWPQLLELISVHSLIVYCREIRLVAWTYLFNSGWPGNLLNSGWPGNSENWEHNEHNEGDHGVFPREWDNVHRDWGTDNHDNSGIGRPFTTVNIGYTFTKFLEWCILRIKLGSLCICSGSKGAFSVDISPRGFLDAEEC